MSATTPAVGGGVVQGPIGPLRGFLERFRRSAGVPGTVSEDFARELAPVFAALDGVEAEAVALRSAAARQAEALLAGVDEEVERILANARQRAAAEGEEERRVAVRAAESRAKTLAAGAQAEAVRIRARAEARIPALVEAVINCVWASPR
jgi:flagellar biosynthesis/type III secretory pathway protein FliH